MKNKLIVMVGLPGSGKSTEASNIAKNSSATIFSSDEYREKMFGSIADQSHNKEIFDKLYKDATCFLSSGSDRTAIIDSTNISLKSRLNLLNRVVSNLDVEKECIVMATPLRDCTKRDSLRKNKVGEETIYKYLESFQFRQYFEGWDNIKLIQSGEKDFLTLNEYIQSMMDFNQNNPHHGFDLYTHCSKMAHNFQQNSPLYWAGMVHDIGKLYTETHDNNGVSHYYNHDNVGVYDIMLHRYLFKEFLDEDFFNMLFYINYHMKAKDWKTDKAIKKWSKIFGEKLLQELIIFSDYDNASMKMNKNDQTGRTTNN